MIKLVDIHKIYNPETIGFLALKNVNLQFGKTGFVSVIGASGSGKTTLMNIIGGLDLPSSGSMAIDGRLIKKFKEEDWTDFRNHKLGFVFQNYSLIEHLNLMENISLPLKIQGVPKDEREKRVRDIFKLVGVNESLNKLPNELSGGQKQRVSIARALVTNPPILLADEPTGALDSETSKAIMELLKEISKDKLVIIVTHNKKIANKYSDRIIEMKDGSVINDSNPIESKVKIKIGYKKQNNNLKFGTMFKHSFINIKNNFIKSFFIAFALAITLTSLLMVDLTSNSLQETLTKGSETKEYISASRSISLDDDPLDIYDELKAISGVTNITKTTELGTTLTTSSLYDIPISHIGTNLVTNKILAGSTDLKDNEIIITTGMASILLKEDNMDTPDEEKLELLKDKEVTLQKYYLENEIYSDLFNLINQSTQYTCTFAEEYVEGQDGARPSNWDEANYGTFATNQSNVEALTSMKYLISIDNDIKKYTYCNDYGFLDKVSNYSDIKKGSPTKVEIVAIVDGWDYKVISNINTFDDFSTTSKVNYGIYSDDIANDDFRSRVYSTLQKHDFTATREEDSDIDVGVIFIRNILGAVINVIGKITTALLITAVITSALMIILIVYTSIVERSRELGILKSIGTSPNNLKSIFTSEFFIISIIAIIVSIILSFTLIVIINNLIISNYGTLLDLLSVDKENIVSFDIMLFIKYSILCIIISMLASLYPTRKISKLSPAKMLRK